MDPYIHKYYKTKNSLSLSLSLFLSKKGELRAINQFTSQATAEPPLRAEGDGGVGVGVGIGGTNKPPAALPLPNCSSWITGFEAQLGGDPQKYGGDEAT